MTTQTDVPPPATDAPPSNPQFAIRNPQSTRRPHPASKISRLPAEAREFINQSLADNVRYSKIIADLEQMGHHGINGPNLSKWARSGYRLWLDSRQQLEIIRAQSEANIHLLRDLGATNSAFFHQLNDLFMATQLAKLMKSFNIDDLQQRKELQDHMPDAFAKYNHRQQNYGRRYAYGRVASTQALSMILSA